MHLFAKILLSFALIGALGLAACSGTTASSNDATTVVDDDTAAGDLGDQDALSGDADGSGKPDSTADQSDGSSKPDASDADAGPGKGCVTDDECAPLVSALCQVGKCEQKTGLCQAVDLADGATCNDLGASQCWVDPVCKAGACQYTFKSCDDGKACTDDQCKPESGCSNTGLKSGDKCSDGDACTLTATCQAGTCAAKAPIDCDDKNVCTQDTCDPMLGCVHTPAGDGTTCTDDKFCTTGDACTAGNCVGVPKDCPDDGNPCTVTKCTEQNKGTCDTAPIAGMMCDDGNPCTSPDVCDGAGKCAGPKNCDDGNPCSDDGCPDPKLGCQHINNAIPCGPLDACNGVGQCKGGSCDAPAKNCDDGNLCTDDSCDKAKGCLSTPNQSGCYDGSVCTQGDTCSGGACKPSKTLSCDDGDPCTLDQCDPIQGCGNPVAPSGTACGSNKQCLVGLCLANTCGDGVCSAKEDSNTCPGDCNQQGGACSGNDGQCLSQCKGAMCAGPLKKCTDSAECQNLTTCLTGASSDESKQLECLTGGTQQALFAYLGYDACMQALCFQNFWSGKGCTGAGQQYVSCIGACEYSMCKLLTLGCKVSAGCTGIRDCMQACPQDGNLTQCVVGCKKKGTDNEALLNAELDTCSATYCQCSPTSLTYPTCGL